MAPIGPRDRPPPLPPNLVAPSPWGERGLLQSKQVRRLAKLGPNPQAVHTQSPGWDLRSVPTWLPFLALRGALSRRPLESPPRELSRLANWGLPPPPPPLALRSTRSRSSRSPCLSVKTSSALRSAAPLRGGIAECTRKQFPPPPWCAATLRLAASRAMSALAACRCRLARRCQACSPRAVAAKRGAERHKAAGAWASGARGPRPRQRPSGARGEAEGAQTAARSGASRG